MIEGKRRKFYKVFDSKSSPFQVFNFKYSLPFIRHKKVLDVGCWSGIYEKMAVGYVKEIIGIDLGKEALEFAKKNVPEAKFYIADARNLKFKKNTFDTVVFLEVIEHLPRGSELTALKEIRRVVKKGGHLILSTPNRNFVSILLDPAYFIIDHRHYSLKELTILIRKSGFNIIKVEYTGNIFELLNDLITLTYKHLFKKPYITPSFVESSIKESYRERGFAHIHLVAEAI